VVFVVAIAKRRERNQMIVLEVAGFVVLLGLAVIATWMAGVGLMGMTGAVRMKRCLSCGHLLTATSGATTVCPYCRHPRLFHHFAHARLQHHLPGDS
jgi:hypothetical protein